MRSIQTRSRRIFLADLGKAAVGLAVLSACSTGAEEANTTLEASTSSAPPPSDPSTNPPSTVATQVPTTTEVPPTTEASPAAAWERVALGGVSAYIVIRGGEAAVIDTGNPGSEAAIGDTLRALGFDWDNVAHVILTHRHRDHVGSVDAVMTLAAASTAYAGAEDIPNIAAPREVVAVGDEDTVTGLEIIATPGHTAGHISVLDPELSLLIAGDSMIGQGGLPAGPVPQFTSDILMANASVVKMSEFEFDTVVFGHGAPVIGGASAAVKQLAAEL